MTTAKRKQPLETKPKNYPIQTGRRAIQLDQSQYQLYLKGEIQIYSPDAVLLETIGENKNIQQLAEHYEQMVDQISLVEALVVTSTGELQLSDRALVGLSTLLAQTRNFIEQ
jgi:hypothetical protein